VGKEEIGRVRGDWQRRRRLLRGKKTGEEDWWAKK
jgi:hypothetical protein